MGESTYTVAFHAGLQGADGVDLSDVHDAASVLHGGGATLADITEAADDDALASKHNVSGAHDTIREGVAAAVHVIELGLGHRVVDVDGGEEQRALLLHLVQAVDTGGGLLADTLAAGGQLVPALGILLQLASDDAQHDAKLALGGPGEEKQHIGQPPWDASNRALTSQARGA